MLTLTELLEDPTYKRFFTTQPAMPRNVHPDALPWRVYAQREPYGRWAKKEFRTYTEAFRFLKPRLTSLHNATIQSTGIAYGPPAKAVKMKRNGRPVLDPKTNIQVVKRIIWQPVLPMGEPEHVWCPYCRRPTVLGWFSRHHAFIGRDYIDQSMKRCTICGASERLIQSGNMKVTNV